jgi:hypothetical protein
MRADELGRALRALALGLLLGAFLSLGRYRSR